MQKDIKFEYADAWLLLAIIYAKQQGVASLSNIIGYGDLINHAIFSTEELQGGIYRLIKSGYIIDRNEEYIPTDKIIEPYKKFTKKRNYVSKELAFIQKQLDSPEWSEDYIPSKANESGSYEKINQEIVNNAYKEYISVFNNKKRGANLRGQTSILESN